MPIKALVVDNNPVLLRAISAFLEQEGCLVTAATNGLEALSCLKSDAPDIIFTDLVMPQVSGEQLCKIIRNTPELKKIYLVVISGIVLEDLENILSAEFYDLCIAKGNLKDLKDHIKDALEQFVTRERDQRLIRNPITARIPKGLEISNIAMELLAERRHVNAVLNSLHEGIVELDKSGTVVSANKAALSILDVKEENIVGMTYDTYNWPEYAEELKCWVQKKVIGGNRINIEPGNESIIKFKEQVLSLTYIPVNEGETVFSVCIIRDITRQFKAEEHERELNNAMALIRKMESLSSMAGGVAHDFNNLLTVICGNLDMLIHKGEGASQEDRKLLLDYAHTAAYKAVELARKISHSSPYGIVSHVEVDLEEIVKNAIHTFSANSNLECLIKCPEMPISVSADPEQIETAIINVLQNSLEASSKDPVLVDISVKDFTKPTVISGQYIPDGSYACITIADQGLGIKEEDLIKIFDPYYSSKQRGASKGMGLGLTVVYATMRNHGGYIAVESEVGIGTTVRLLLPVGNIGSANSLNLVSEPKDGRSKHILLVEQDEQNREICKTIIEFLGWRVTAVDDFQGLIGELHKKSGQQDGGVDAILLNPLQFDINATELFAAIKAADSLIQIVVLGVSLLDSRLDFFKNCGASLVLPKPYTFESIKKLLNDI